MYQSGQDIIFLRARSDNQKTSWCWLAPCKARVVSRGKSDMIIADIDSPSGDTFRKSVTVRNCLLPETAKEAFGKDYELYKEYKVSKDEMERLRLLNLERLRKESIAH